MPLKIIAIAVTLLHQRLCQLIGVIVKPAAIVVVQYIAACLSPGVVLASVPYLASLAFRYEQPLSTAFQPESGKEGALCFPDHQAASFVLG
ncbi:hypothetical protein ACFSFZ_19330 [Mixta tenebrionis]|uniref:hypothetical protein n=1 Tax=Mixta tenebrionis TaxID=2562439 RepID=UPI00363C88DC